MATVDRRFSVNRRTFLASGTLFTTGLLATGAFAQSAKATCASGPDPLTALEKPKLRWWWPGGAIDPAEIRREVNQMADAGFGGFEIADVRDSQEVPTDPATQGWASPAWIAGVEAALEAAAERGLVADITLGAHWPTGVPGVMPDDDAASKEMVHGEAGVTGGARFKGAVPPPLQAKPSGELPVNNENPPVTPKLLAVQAFRTVTANDVTTLDPASMIDLTAKVTGGQLDWKAPRGGEWRILSFWMRGTAQIQNMFDRNKKASMLAEPRPYVIDIYGKAAAAALTDYWERHLLPSRTRALMKKVGGSFFEDSLEVSAATNWSPDLLAEFENRRGYSLQPFLAALPAKRGSFPGEPGSPVYQMRGVDISRVRHDFDRTLAEMYNEYRVGAISRWAHDLGMKFRVQVVGSNVNSSLAATYADIPEGDNSNDIHGWRAFAAGRDIGGHKLLSDEAATFVGGSAHVATWRDMLYMLQRDYAGGVNSVVIHGFSYADGPGATWPGFSAFGAAIGNDWGPRDPNWEVAGDVSSYLGRIQKHLQAGRAVTDLAVVNRPLKSINLRRAGYTFQYPAMELFERDDAVVRNGRLWAEGPAYKALVLNKVEALDPEFAERMIGYAEAGLPIVVVGSVADRGRGWKDAASQDNAVQARMGKLLAMDNVAQVAKSSQLAGALGKLGVAPSLGFASDARYIGLRRKTDTADCYYLLNDDTKDLAERVTLTGSGAVYRIDPWTGEASAVAGTSRAGERISFELPLAMNEVALLVVSETPPACLAAMPVAHTGKQERIALGDWTLEVEDWKPGGSASATVKPTVAVGKTALVPWSQIAAIQSSSGVGRYRTTVNLSRWRQGSSARLDLGTVGGTPRVFVNGKQVPGVNLWTDTVEIGPWLRKGSNLLEVLVATPLNNRLKAEGIESDFGPPSGAEGGEGGPPPMMFPEPKAPDDPDEIDGPAGGPGMQAGAGAPGGKRKLQDYGLFGPVMLEIG